MANTYTQIYLHVVFGGFWSRVCDFSERRKSSKIHNRNLTRKRQKLIAIYCMSDHTHILLGLKPSIAPSDLSARSKPDRPIILTTRSGSDADFRGRKDSARFRFVFASEPRSQLYSQSRAASSSENRFKEEYVEFLERHRVPFDQHYISSR